MTLAEVLPFPPRRAAALAERVRAEMLAMADSAEMMVYIQEALPKHLPHLGEIVLDSTFSPRHGLFAVYLYGGLPGMPLLFRSECLKSCLVGCALRLCQIPPPQPGPLRPVEGFTPVYVRPLGEFKKVR